jgi:hypothetical protein
VLECPEIAGGVDVYGSPPGEIVHFHVGVTDRDPAPVLTCSPESGSFFPRGTTIVTCTATDASGNSATCEFPVHVLSKVRER